MAEQMRGDSLFATLDFSLEVTLVVYAGKKAAKE